MDLLVNNNNFLLSNLLVNNDLKAELLLCKLLKKLGVYGKITQYVFLYPTMADIDV